MLVQGGSVSYAQEWAVGANITGVWLPRDHRAPLFSTLSRIIRVRASGIICGARHRPRISKLVPLDRPKSHEISMRNPY
jgi:hypothetical protein